MFLTMNDSVTSNKKFRIWTLSHSIHDKSIEFYRMKDTLTVSSFVQILQIDTSMRLHRQQSNPLYVRQSRLAMCKKDKMNIKREKFFSTKYFYILCEK